MMGDAGRLRVGAALPDPLTVMSNGASSGSSLGIRTTALRAPEAVGLKATVKVVLAPAARLLAMPGD